MHNNVMFDCIRLDMGKNTRFSGNRMDKKRKIKTKKKKCGALLWSIVGGAALLYPLIFIATLPR